MTDERRDDWRHSVDESLVNLTTAQKVTDRQLQDIEKVITKLDRVISGDPEADLAGLVERMHYLDRELNRLNSVVFMDSTGKKGLLKTVQDISEGREDRRINWGNWTKIIVAAIMSGALVNLWPEIKASYQAKSKDPVAIMIEKAKNPKPRRIHYTIRESSEATEESPLK